MNIPFIRQVGFRQWALRYGSLLVRRKILRMDSRLKLPTGGTMILPRDSPSASEVWVTGANIDWGSEALFARFADRRRDFLDIGAHVGYYACYLSPLVRRAYAFEPDQRNLGTLRANARLSSNVDVVECAVSSRTGTATMYLGSRSAVNSLVPAGAGSATVEVAVTTVDAFVFAHPGVDPALIKTDVEGHDLEALLGMQATVERCQPLILTESAYRSELAELCSAWGYALYAFIRDRLSMRTSFRRLEPEQAAAAWYKMLFLVPARLRSAFDDRLTR
jgi:FkbM family methyltransferase